MIPVAASRPNVLPPVRSTAWQRSTTVPVRSPSVASVPGAPPRTSTPPTAPPGARTTVHPVRPLKSDQCPTLKPPGRPRFTEPIWAILLVAGVVRDGADRGGIEAPHGYRARHVGRRVVTDVRLDFGLTRAEHLSRCRVGQGERD